MGRVISFPSQCGGVGKTTLCVNLAAALGAAGRRVLLVDLDARGCATAAIGASARGGTVAELLSEDEEAGSLLTETAAPNVLLLAADGRLAEAETALVYKKDGETALREALRGVQDAFDDVLLDCPPSLGALTVGALTASDGVLIPVDCERFSSDALAKLTETIALVRNFLNGGLREEGIVLTMYDRRALTARETEAVLRRDAPEKVYETVIPRTPRTAEGMACGRPVVLLDPKSIGARAFGALAEEFLKKQRG